MNRGNNYTVQQVLQRLQTDQLDDSCDENEETELQDKEFVLNCCAGVESCDSDTDSGEDEQSSAAVAIDFYRSISISKYCRTGERTKRNCVEKHNRCSRSGKSIYVQCVFGTFWPNVLLSQICSKR